MGVARKINRNKAISHLKNKSLNEFAQNTRATIEEQAREIVAEYIAKSFEYLALALEGTFKEEYGFGKKRLNYLFQRLNDRLPDYMQIGDVPLRKKIDTDRLYDVVEMLLEVGCDEKCKLTKNHKNCMMYKIFKSNYIEPYGDDESKCPYQIIPGKLSDNQIHCLKMSIRTRLRKLENQSKSEGVV